LDLECSNLTGNEREGSGRAAKAQFCCEEKLNRCRKESRDEDEAAGTNKNS